MRTAAVCFSSFFLSTAFCTSVSPADESVVLKGAFVNALVLAEEALTQTHSDAPSTASIGLRSSRNGVTVKLPWRTQSVLYPAGSVGAIDPNEEALVSRDIAGAIVSAIHYVRKTVRPTSKFRWPDDSELLQELSRGQYNVSAVPREKYILVNVAWYSNGNPPAPDDCPPGRSFEVSQTTVEVLKELPSRCPF